MIIFVPQNQLHRHITWSYSPLFELASSLLVLTRSQTEERHRQWTNQTLDVINQEHFSTDLQYFSAVFNRTIPWIFHPNQTNGIEDSEDMFAYILNISHDNFREAFSTALHGETITEVKHPLPVEIDLQRDPEFVRGRFLLFLATYWEAVFSSTWQQILPLLEKEAEKISEACSSVERFQHFLQSMPISIRLEENSIPDQEVHELHFLHMYPSTFYSGSPIYQFRSGVGHLLYPI